VPLDPVVVKVVQDGQALLLVAPEAKISGCVFSIVGLWFSCSTSVTPVSICPVVGSSQPLASPTPLPTRDMVAAKATSSTCPYVPLRPSRDPLLDKVILRRGLEAD